MEETEGLSTAEAKDLLAKVGANEIREEKPRFFRTLFEKLWGPIPWILEAALVLEVSFGKVAEPILIAALLLFSALFGGAQKIRAQKALGYLRSRLQVVSHVFRDGIWQVLSARELVPGDLIRIRVGDFIPADCTLLEGNVEVDQSALTGEAALADRSRGETLYSGSIVRRGDATAKVTATGPRSYFGRTAELVRRAHPVGHLEELLFSFVRYLILIDGIFAAILIGAVYWQGIALLPLVPFLLVLLIATVPITMPSAFTVANAIEAKSLAKEGVLVTELSAVQEAATMDVLCVDKTGTLTLNRQTVAAIASFSGATQDQILTFARASCDESEQTPLEQAIFEACRKRSLPKLFREKFIPFDPEKKYSECLLKKEGKIERIVLGFPPALAKLIPSEAAFLNEQVALLAKKGERVLALAGGPDGGLRLYGLIALADTPREDAKPLIEALRNLGIRILMVTGDTLETAEAIGRSIGLGKRFAALKDSLEDPLRFDGFANCYPEDKLLLVKSLQRSGRIGMTGDGINDAPALKQAEVGIAVSTANDVAKASARVVLTEPGLQNIVSIVLGGRRVYRRMLTWTITKIMRTVELAALFTFGFIATGIFITPLFLIVLIIIMNDIVTMSVATDRAMISMVPEQWKLKEIIKLSSLFALGWTFLGFGILWAAFSWFQMPVAEVQTVMFAYLIYSAQITSYLSRVQGRFWSFSPSFFFGLATMGNMAAATLLAAFGVFMTSVSILNLVGLLGVVLVAGVLLDEIKIRVFRNS